MNDSQKGGARLMKSEHKRRELAPVSYTHLTLPTIA